MTIIGEGNYKNELKNLRDNLGLTKCVTFWGGCERDIILSNFWQSDVFILISLAESFGNVFIEAMACGLPIIGPNKGGIPDLVSEENGILVQPDNIQQIKSAILTMKNNKEMRIRMGKVNSEKAKEYSWGKIALAYKDIYMKNLNGHDKQN